MIRRGVVVLAIGLLLLGGGAVAMFRVWGLVTEAPPGSAADASVPFRVDAGEGLASVAGRLQAEGLVVSARRFRWLARIRRVDRDVQAGTYRFDRGTDPRALLRDLVLGRVRSLRLTIPEGWRVDRIAEEVVSALGVSPDALQAAITDGERRARFGGGESLEGYLYPDTYFFADGVTAGDVVDAMLSHFDVVWESLEGDAPAGMDRHAVVTLASIVVAETSLSEEKPRVAAVYLNRIRERWRLEADPTVRYGLGRFTGRLYFKHLDVDTPYNTYMHHGLPPGPIASPGRESLQAVLAPLVPCEDFFFVASGDGGHIFSRTKAQHDNARRRVRSAGNASGSR